MELKEFRNLKVGEKFNLGYKRFEVKKVMGVVKIVEHAILVEV